MEELMKGKKAEQMGKNEKAVIPLFIGRVLHQPRPQGYALC